MAFNRIADQVSQVRGFADQRLRQPDNPLDPSNRRISLIVQYILKDNSDNSEPAENKSAEKDATGEHDSAATAEKIQRSLPNTKRSRNLEADLCDLTVIADEPPGVRIGECNSPESVGAIHPEPRLAFVGSPRYRSRRKVRCSFRCDYNRPIERGIRGFRSAKGHALRIRQSEDGSPQRRLVCKRPGVSAILSGCRLDTIVHREVSATDDSVRCIAERN